ncbi:hypothetical protein [Solemya velum gill symbiont]|uniref:Uncharacterized protein n=1 Tax=Solemya velum gill symbiont TaxID=2340 RepID=A0A1T2CQR4_SOVGS|nr:hypothetical protein [Solemya velum gill symbiont]OOY33839.1 hypothetical protein BOV88_13160 [Solemya velum gill symbiont]OOY37074.1 hypothetical protein BOV89_08960 [Solemya velum gill symbiont]OOY44395.1 hypothetical protein BOV92_08800 [Solemya velum gill symbiont]
MLWKSGWLLNSLKYKVEKDIRDTLFKNDVFLRNRWSLPERLVVLGSKHVFIANVVLFSIASVCFFLIAEYYALIQSLLPKTLSGLGSLVEFQSTVFGAQVTLLGLIFPLVIAFIGILLQGKSSNESMWVIYRHNSGFMLVGFSALTLSLSFVLLKIYEPWLTHQFLVAASISTTAWFLTNLVLSGWFLWKTVAFLSLNSRMTMVVKYAINEVVPSDIKNRLLVHHGLSAINTGLLLNPKNESLDVNTFSAKDLENSIFHQYSKPRRIINVWYRILNIGIWFFSLQAKFQKTENSPVTLSLPFSVDNNFTKELLLAKTNSDGVNWISKILIKIAVRTTSKPAHRQLNVEQVVGALFGQLEDSLKDNNSRLFDSAKENLVQFHRDIESSMFFINDNDEPDNWLLLPEGRWLRRSFLDVFVRESSDIAKDVTRRIQDDSNYYESWCYLYPRLFNSQKADSPIKVAETYIDGHYLIWGKLMSWMGGFDKNNNVSAQQRDRAIKHFVGSWEHWRNLLDNDFESVKSKDFLIALRHLNDSCCMIVYACKYNNNDAAIWATDVLSHWFELFSNSNIGYQYILWNHELITTKALGLDSEHSLLKSLTCNNDFPEVEAATIGLRNYWTDLRCLTAAYLLATSHNKKNDYKNLIDALISGNRLAPTGNIDVNHSPLASAKDILGVYLRQHGSWETQSDYRALMEQHLDRLARIEEPEWVSGRIYSSSGTKRDLYLPNLFKVIGIGLTTNKFKIDQKWLEFLKSNAISQADLESTISSLKALINVEDSIINSVSDYFEIDLEESKKKSQFFVSSIEEIIAELESTISKKIINAPIDQNRLLQFGVAASGSTFTLSDGPMPVMFFDDIDYKDDFNSDLVVTNIVDYRKSEVSQGLEVNRAINEDEWLNNVVSQRMQTTCFQQLLKHSAWKEVEFDDAKSLVLKAVEDSQSITDNDQTPIMFIGPWDVYKLIDSSRWEYGREDEKLPLDISVESNKPNGYICHIAGIEIYRLPFSKADFSILLSKETFKKINIKRFGDGRYVEATFNTENNTDLTGTLSLSFGVECKFNATGCFKYISRNPDE